MGHKEQYQEKKKEILSDKSINSYNRNLFKNFFEWEEEKLKRTNGLTKLDTANYKTLKDYPRKLRNVNKWFKNKPWNTLTIEEIKKVYNDLEDGKIKNGKGKPITDKRSYYIKIFKAKPFKLAGLNGKVEEALEFFTDNNQPEVEFIRKDTFENMISVLSRPHHLALFWLAWDIGENINSLLQLKKKHFKRQINEDTKEQEYVIYLPKDILKRARQTRTEPTIYLETVKVLDVIFDRGKEIQERDKKTKHFLKKTYAPYKDDDLVFSFEYRQALKLFDVAVRKVNAKCEPTGRKPSWTHLRKGMACQLWMDGWSVEDINVRLGHSPMSQQLSRYLNYLKTKRKRVIKERYQSNISELKEDIEERKQTEKALLRKVESLKEEFGTYIPMLEALQQRTKVNPKILKINQEKK
ncbi:hypothetical protein ES703_87819 [subsurface metagenome]